MKEIPDNDAKILALKSGELTALLGSDKLTYDGFAELKASGFGSNVNASGTRTMYMGMRIADTNIWNETYLETGVSFEKPKENRKAEISIKRTGRMTADRAAPPSSN